MHLFLSECPKALPLQVNLFAQGTVPPDCPSIGRTGNDRRVHHAAVSDHVAALHVLVYVLLLSRNVDEKVAILGHVACVCVGGGHGRRIQKSVVARRGGVARLVVIVDGIVLPGK